MKNHLAPTGYGMMALSAFVGALVFCCAAIAVPAPSDGYGILTISIAGAKSEMPAVRFNHETHAKFVKEQKGVCGDCHKHVTDAERRDAKAFAFVDVGKSMSVWHDACLKCHDGQDRAPKASACRVCHAGGDRVQQPVVFGRALHTLHIESKHIPVVQPLQSVGEVKNCGACHSVRNEILGGVGYTQNIEDASTFYGTGVTSSEAKAKIAHTTCVVCHVATMNTKPELSLPVDCAACHSPKGQSAFPDASKAKRLFRGQKDMLLLGKAADGEGKSVSQASDAALKRVSFKHEAHEKIAECGICHGMTIGQGSASSMVTMGTKDVSAFKAAHDAGMDASCAGCHKRTVLADGNCAGCHKALTFTPSESCDVCHDGGNAVQAVAPVSVDDVPEIVTIKGLVNEYETVTLPHRRIYQRLSEGMKDSGLAKAFHRESTCKACHHNVPDRNIKNPPNCVACHGASTDAVKYGQLPALKAAYHQMCLDCHVAMNVKPAPSECAKCHAPAKGKSQPEVR